MKYALWYSPSEYAWVLLHEADRESRQLKPADAVVIWEVEADTYQEAVIKASVLLGQMYFERPGGCAPLDTGEFLSEVRAAGIKEITVVDLRSADGMKRMCQEFYGRIEGIERISNMLLRRLGPEMSNWTVVVSHVLGRPADGERTSSE